MEDFVTWTDTSRIRKHVLDYNEEARLLNTYMYMHTPSCNNACSYLTNHIKATTNS